jgi:signal transduction histidine kinase
VTSLRVRLTAGATLLGGVTFAIGGLLVLTVYHNNLVTDRERAARFAAANVASAAKATDLPRPIPMPVSVDVPRIQVVDDSGRVLTGDPASADQPPMLVPGGGNVPQYTTLTHASFLPGRRVYLVALPVAGPSGGGGLTVEAAISLDPADDRATQAARQAAIALGGGLIVVVVSSWLVVGRALAPVERMRTQVAAIAAVGALTERVPVPTGHDEIGRLGQTLNDMLHALDEAQLRQRQFVADAAHELRTPVAGVTAFLDVAVRHPEAIDRHELASRLLAAHERLAGLVDDLLTLASMDAHAPARHCPVDFTEIVRDSLRQAWATPVHAELVGTVMVLGNEAQLARMVGNLIDNATRYARTNVRLSLSQTGRTAVLTVLDDGPGIPADKQDLIWQRFARLDEDRSRAGGGAGLGLAIVREVVAAHRGTAQVSNAEGGGALFTVRVPLTGQP